MPLLDSFKVDHTRMNAPAVRQAKRLTGPKGDVVTVYDLRFTKPNESMLEQEAIHTMEHLFAGFLRDHLDNYEVIDVSPMGCRTGFYMSMFGCAPEQVVAEAWYLAMQDVLRVKCERDIPELNIYQCGTYSMHSLSGAQEVAQMVLNKGITINRNEDLELPANVTL